MTDSILCDGLLTDIQHTVRQTAYGMIDSMLSDKLHTVRQTTCSVTDSIQLDSISCDRQHVHVYVYHVFNKTCLSDMSMYMSTCGQQNMPMFLPKMCSTNYDYVYRRHVHVYVYHMLNKTCLSLSHTYPCLCLHMVNKTCPCSYLPHAQQKHVYVYHRHVHVYIYMCSIKHVYVYHKKISKPWNDSKADRLKTTDRITN